MVPQATVKDNRELLKAAHEALDRVGDKQIFYKLQFQLQMAPQEGLTLDQIKTSLRKLDDALEAFRQDAVMNLGVEITHDSPVEKAIVKETYSILKAKQTIEVPKKELLRAVPTPPEVVE